MTINIINNNKYATFNCDWCEKEHTQKLSNYKRTKTHFCSKSCSINYRWKDNNIIKEKKLKEKILCNCGCGQELNKYTLVHKHGGIRERKYIIGHQSKSPNSGQFKKGISSWNKNIPMSDETKLKLSIIAKEQWKDGMSLESRIKLSCSLRNINIEDFDGFVTDDDPRKLHEERKLHEDWKKLIFERDNYTCKICGRKRKRGDRVILNSHHIKSWKNFPELRRNLDNGITLCVECHKYVHSKKYKYELEVK